MNPVGGNRRIPAGRDGQADPVAEGLSPRTIPALRVAMQGTALAGPGRIRTPGADDAKTHSYDNRYRTYQPNLLDR